MLMAAFFKWWYGPDWIDAWRRLGRRLEDVTNLFSVKLLMRTLFSPWRRVTSARGRGLDAALHAAIDNAVGRFIGFLVRFVVLVSAAISIVVIALFGSVLLLLWPIAPVLVVGLAIIGAIR